MRAIHLRDSVVKLLSKPHQSDFNLQLHGVGSVFQQLFQNSEMQSQQIEALKKFEEDFNHLVQQVNEKNTQIQELQKDIAQLQAENKEIKALNYFGEWISFLFTRIVVMVNKEMNLNSKERYTWDSLIQDIYEYVSFIFRTININFLSGR